MHLVRYICFIAVIGGILAWCAVLFADSEASTSSRFTPLAAYDSYRLEIDASTKQAVIDQDGDTLVGAVVRLTPASPMSAQGITKPIGTFVNTVVAICGHHGIILTRSQMFDVAGDLVDDQKLSEPMPADTPTTPAAEIYGHLCSSYIHRRGNNFT